MGAVPTKTQKSGKANDSKGATTAAPVSAPTKSQSLYDISREYSEFEDLMNSIDGEISDADQQRIDEFLSGLDKDRNAKIDAYCGIIRNFVSRSEIRDKEAKRFAQLARWDKNKAERLKRFLLIFLQTHNFPTIETDKFRVRRAANGAIPLEIDKSFEDKPELLPERFRTQVFVLNKVAIKEALDAGEDLGFARYGEKGENLRIE